MSCIQRQCPTAYEERNSGATKRNSQAYYNYVRFVATLRKAVGGVKNHQRVRSADSQEKADWLLKSFQEVYNWDQVKQGLILDPVTLLVKIREKQSRRKKSGTA